jgi:hypothetical protein
MPPKHRHRDNNTRHGEVNPIRHDLPSSPGAALERSDISSGASSNREQGRRWASKIRRPAQTPKDEQIADSGDDSDDDNITRSDDDNTIGHITEHSISSVDINFQVLVAYLKEYLGEDSEAHPKDQVSREPGYLVRSNLGLSSVGCTSLLIRCFLADQRRQ